jgi:hypothetical protein
MHRIMLIPLALALLVSITPTAEANALRNPGFEEGGQQPETSLFWKMHDPDDHGDAWGNAIRVDWRARDGRWTGAVRGSWAGLGEYGGFWQEAEITPGTSYRASAWFWADGAWTAETQELKLEFWNADRSMILDSHSVALHDIAELWIKKELEGVAPEGAAWARVVINVSDAGDSGALQIDDVALETGW